MLRRRDCHIMERRRGGSGGGERVGRKHEFHCTSSRENKKRCATVGIRAQEGGRRMALDTQKTSESILKYILHGFNVHTKIEGNNQDLY